MSFLTSNLQGQEDAAAPALPVSECRTDGGSEEGAQRGCAGVHTRMGAPHWKVYGSLSSQARQRGGNKGTRPDAVAVAASTSATAAHGHAMPPSEQESGTFACLSFPFACAEQGQIALPPCPVLAGNCITPSLTTP